jgi:hypothetical protein
VHAPIGLIVCPEMPSLIRFLVSGKRKEEEKNKRNWHK